MINIYCVNRLWIGEYMFGRLNNSLVKDGF